MKLIYSFAIGLLFSFSTLTFAADESWTGELYNIMPNNSHTTLEYCKSHVLDTYKTTPQDKQTQVTANNRVTAKDTGSTAKQIGGVYFYTANVLFSGVTDGKKWQEKGYFSYYGLDKESSLQGVWYTKNCKGLYKSGPTL